MLEILNKDEVMGEYVLGKIIRYNHRNRLQDESVATHSFYVSLFCLKIMAKLDIPEDIERQVLIAAALHDAAESITSDIPHDVKANYPEMEKILSKIEKDYYEKNWPAYANVLYKPNNLVYNIIKLADAYSVQQYCLNENKLGNNSQEIQDILNEATIRIKTRTAKVNELLDDYNETRKIWPEPPVTEMLTSSENFRKLDKRLDVLLEKLDVLEEEYYGINQACKFSAISNKRNKTKEK